MNKKNQKPMYINTETVNLFIPRLLPNISKEFIQDYFKDNQIGVITYINAKHRVNENKNPYWFAFINIHFLDTFNGREMYDLIVEREKTAYMTYNETEGKYWEISLRSQDRKDKKKTPPNKPKPVVIAAAEEVVPEKVVPEEVPIILLEDGEIDETNFTIYDHMEIYKDYMELEKEIYGNNAFSWSQSPYIPSILGEFIPIRV